MQKAKVPSNETQRLNALKQYNILDTIDEQCFDDITQLASEICDTPIALISLVDENRQWFKSKVGLDASETPRDIAFCSHAILGDEIFEIPNALEDERFSDNPLVTNPPSIRFYAGAPLKTPNGENLGTLCVISDKPSKLSAKQSSILKLLSREVVAQLELKLKNKNLNEALAQLHQQQQKITQAKEEAEQATLSKSRFLANMSHEIRTPLHGILNLAELGIEDNAISEKNACLKGIKSSAEVLSNIVNDILDFSKIEAGKLEIESIKFGLLEVVQSTAKALKIRANEKGISFLVNTDEKIEKIVYGDPVRVTQIINNLCTNAIKFTEQGKVELNIKVMEESSDYQLIMFEVVDTGIGIDDSKKSSLFQEFNQVDISTARKYGGTGLGLAICKSLSLLMGGDLSFESKKGEGSTFRYTQKYPVSKLSNINIAIHNDVNLNQAKVLVAEDNRINQTIIKRMLSRHNAQVTLVNNGQECVEHFNNNDVDIILMDIQMPVMDGVTATKTIRESKTGKDIPIIAMTANTMRSDVEQYFDIGMSGYLGKPFDKNKLNYLLNIYNPKTMDNRVSQLASKIGNPYLSVESKLETICQHSKKLIQHANRISIWIFEQDYRVLKCLYGIDEKDQPINDLVLNANDYPQYFEFILQNQVLDASNARENPSTICFKESYFEPLNIYSLLDFTFNIDDKPVGVICCERVGSSIDWTNDNKEDLIKIANVATLFFAEEAVNNNQ